MQNLQNDIAQVTRWKKETQDREEGGEDNLLIEWSPGIDPISGYPGCDSIDTTALPLARCALSFAWKS